MSGQPETLYRRRQRMFTLGLALLSLVFAFLLAEALVRLSGFAPARNSPAARLVDPRWRELLDCYPTNPRGYFEIDLREAANKERYRHLAPLRFDAVAQRAPFAVHFKYNSLRFRDAEPTPKPAGRRRVVVVGDSFTEGQGVKEPDTLPRQLEVLLNGQEPAAWEVRSCGRRALDFPGLLDGFEAALTLEPDVVVYAMVLNDPVRSPEFAARQRYVNDWILDRGQTHEAGAAAVRRWYDSRLLAFARTALDRMRIGRETARWYVEMYGPENGDGWAQTQALIRDMQRRTQARGARFVLVLWPLLVGIDAAYPFDAVHGEVERFCRSAGIEELDLLPVLKGRAPGELWVHPIDMHPNERAQRLAAEAVATVLTRVQP